MAFRQAVAPRLPSPQPGGRPHRTARAGADRTEWGRGHRGRLRRPTGNAGRQWQTSWPCAGRPTPRRTRRSPGKLAPPAGTGSRKPRDNGRKSRGVLLLPATWLDTVFTAVGQSRITGLRAPLTGSVAALGRQNPGSNRFSAVDGHAVAGEPDPGPAEWGLKHPGPRRSSSSASRRSSRPPRDQARGPAAIRMGQVRSVQVHRLLTSDKRRRTDGWRSCRRSRPLFRQLTPRQSHLGRGPTPGRAGRQRRPRWPRQVVAAEQDRLAPASSRRFRSTLNYPVIESGTVVPGHRTWIHRGPLGPSATGLPARGNRVAFSALLRVVVAMATVSLPGFAFFHRFAGRG